MSEMTALWTFVLSLLRVLIPALLDKIGTGMSDSAAPADVKKGIHDKIVAKWGAAGALLLAVVLLTGCISVMPRTVYVPDGEPVRLRETIEDVKVWVMTENGPQPSTLTLHEGWYAVSYKEAVVAGE